MSDLFYVSKSKYGKYVSGQNRRMFAHVSHKYIDFWNGCRHVCELTNLSKLILSGHLCSVQGECSDAKTSYANLYVNTCHWCFSAGKKLTISYPCVMLNVDVARNNTNDQYQVRNTSVIHKVITYLECVILLTDYWKVVHWLICLLSYQTLNDPVNKLYTTHSECSIEFEVDGPYKVKYSNGISACAIHFSSLSSWSNLCTNATMHAKITGYDSTCL